MDLSDRLGRSSIGKRDADADEACPSSMTFIRMFGSWKEALKAAGLEEGKKTGRPPREKPNLMPRKKPWPDDDPLRFPETDAISNDPKSIMIDEHLVWKGNRLDPAFLRSVNEDARDEIAKDVFNFVLKCDIMSCGYDEGKVRRDFENLKNSRKAILESGGTLSVSSAGASGHRVYRHFFPNILKISSGSRPSVFEVLSDRKKLWSVIRNRIGNTLLYSDSGGPPLQYPMPITMSQLAIGAKNSGLASMGSIFKPDVARAVYRRWVKDGDRVLDYSCGFGTRLLGLMASGVRASYLGYEPNTETHAGIVRMASFFGFGDLDVRCSGSEDGEEFSDVSFAFSSPPYFSHERYCDEPTQCYIRYPEYAEWLEMYWRRTVSRVRRMLSPDGVFGVNIGNKANAAMRSMEEDVRRVVESEGFEPVETVWMSTSRSHLTGKKGTGRNTKAEGMFFYRKAPMVRKTVGSSEKKPSGAKIVCGDMTKEVPKLESPSDLAIMSPPDVSEMGDDFGEYERFLTKAYAAAADNVRPGGVVASSTTDRRSSGRVYPKHSRIADIMFSLGFVLEDHKIWAKTLKANLYIPTFAHVMVFRKPGTPRVKNKVSEFLPDVWHIPVDKAPGSPKHDSFPTELVRRLVDRYSNPGDMVLDPFSGSGKTASVCMGLGRKCICIDISPSSVSASKSLIP